MMLSVCVWFWKRFKLLCDDGNYGKGGIAMARRRRVFVYRLELYEENG